MQLARIKEEAASAKSEAARSGAEAEFERDRSARLASALETQRQQLEGLMGSNAKYQALVTETERRLRAAQAQAEEFADKVSMLPGPDCSMCTLRKARHCAWVGA